MFKVAKSEFTSAVGDLADISADTAEALDLKSEAALLEARQPNLEIRAMLWEPPSLMQLLKIPIQRMP